MIPAKAVLTGYCLLSPSLPFDQRIQCPWQRQSMYNCSVIAKVHSPTIYFRSHLYPGLQSKRCCLSSGKQTGLQPAHLHPFMWLEVILYHPSLLQSFLTYYWKNNKPRNNGSIPLNDFSCSSQDHKITWKAATHV